MISIRRSKDRGHIQLDWLDSYHSFSFADYFDADFMGFRQLRVINEDRVQPGQGFGTHGHSDMEILSYVLEGGLAHRDSMGNGSVIRPGDVQRMSAGTGVTHSEFNASKTKLVHLLQIWIFPENKNLTPGYEQKSFASEMKKEGLVLLASGAPAERAVKIHQDAGIYHGHLKSKGRIAYEPKPGRGIWIQMITGSADILKNKLEAGDGAAIENQRKVEITAGKDCRFLLFDLK